MNALTANRPHFVVRAENWDIAEDKDVQFAIYVGEGFFKQGSENPRELLVWQPTSLLQIDAMEQRIKAIAPFIVEGAILNFYANETTDIPAFRYIVRSGKAIRETPRLVWAAETANSNQGQNRNGNQK